MVKKLRDRCKVTSTGCWEFQGYKDEKGYGKIRVGKRIRRAHRYSYELAKGPIPKGMYVCHKCDNPSCCNPDHLFLGTPKGNTQDMIRKDRAYFYFQHNKVKKQGHPVIVGSQEYESLSQAGRALGVSDNTIRKRIARGVPGYSYTFNL